ncbi:HEAT repeat domain-containing protein [Methanocella conradii]|uniref:HEAT repeat domain-containing protein n=1 Tax=Methanocella conradii TaxID=1175444 RepID=UPI0009DAA8FB
MVSLDKLSDHEAVERLIDCLNDPDPSIRGKAAWALGKIGDLRAIDPLILGLNDKDPNVAYEANRALYCLGWNRL